LTHQSDALSLVSRPLPELPPGSRSIDWPCGGAGATVPSTNAFAAVPQLTASITPPLITRSAIVPPVLAMPLLYVSSASDAKRPALLAIRRWRCDGIVALDHETLRVMLDPVEVT
jgi:hypothetical protein